MTDTDAPLSEAELAQIEERHAKATPGFWDAFHIFSPAGVSQRIFADDPQGSTDIAHIPMEWAGDGRNGLFIAAAHHDIPRLLADVRRLRAALMPFAECADYLDQQGGPKLPDGTGLWMPQTNTGRKLPGITIKEVREASAALGMKETEHG